jgi:hypothetical protein
MRIINIGDEITISVRALIGVISIVIGVGGAFWAVRADARDALERVSAIEAKRDASDIVYNATMIDLRTGMGNMKGDIGRVEGKVDAIILLMAGKK